MTPPAGISRPVFISVTGKLLTFILWPALSVHGTQLFNAWATDNWLWNKMLFAIHNTEEHIHLHGVYATTRPQTDCWHKNLTCNNHVRVTSTSKLTSSKHKPLWCPACKAPKSMLRTLIQNPTFIWEMWIHRLWGIGWRDSQCFFRISQPI